MLSVSERNIGICVFVMLHSSFILFNLFNSFKHESLCGGVPISSVEVGKTLILGQLRDQGR